MNVYKVPVGGVVGLKSRGSFKLKKGNTDVPMSFIYQVPEIP